MAGMATAATAISAVASGIGSFVSARGTIAAGREQQRALEYEAQQLDIQAKEERAASQQEALQYRRARDLALSSLTTRAASSGFMADDPTALDLAGEIGSYGELQAQTARYVGESRAAGITAQAGARRLEGRNIQRAARRSAFGTILGGISTMASRFLARAPASAGSGRYG